MSDRLQELLRQRALLQEHLDWLNREIASATGEPSLPMESVQERIQPSGTMTPPPLPARHRDTATQEAERIMGQLKKDASVVKTDARRGCLTIFSVAMGLLGLGAIIAYCLYARHLGRWW
jgi:hypothetical protein